MPAARSPRVRAALAAVTAILAALALFQLALALGAPWGRAAWGGQHEVLPVGLRIGSLSSIAIYAVVAWVAHRRVAAPDSRPFRIAMWCFAGYFSLGIVLNLASSSPWERFLMAPTALVLAVACFVLAASPPPSTS